MRTLLRTGMAVLAVLVMSAALGLVPQAGARAESSCAVHWGSLPKGGYASSSASIVDVRGGEHACFDRLVIDVGGPLTGAYHVHYVDEVPASESRRLRGGAVLQVLVRAGAEEGDDAVPAYRPADRRELVDVAGWRTFRQVALSGTSEGEARFGLGVRARLPFRVFVLPGPNGTHRLVVHVAHRW